MRGRDYVELRALVAVAQHKNFARAAKQLRITPSALSQTIRALETRLGVRLLNRTTRSVAPTDVGSKLLSRVTPALGELDAALGDVTEQGGRIKGSVRINSARAIALQYFSPILGAFTRAHPDVVLDLVVDDRISDIVAGGFDAGVRLGESLAKDMIAVRLGGEQQQVAVATRRYLAKHGTPRSPRDLAQHRCINLRMASDLSLYRWEFEHRRERLEVAVDGPLIVNDTELALQGALQSVGIAYLFREQVAPALASGKLVPLLEHWSPPFAGFYLYYPSRRYVPPALRALIDFVRRDEP